MPTYEYKCTSCGKEFEYQQRMSEAPKDLCEACGGKLERLISRTAFQLKGGGWYKDLYSSSKPGESGGEKKPTESAPASGSESTSATASPAPAPAPASSNGSSGGGSDSGGGSKTGGGSTAAAAPKGAA
jgi:putative FmdB family regulatory protein